MKDLDKIGEELFSKLRGRFKTVTIGNEAGQVTNMPNESRFYEFEYNKGSKVSVSLDNDKISVMYSDKLFDDDQDATKQNWFDFLKELRTFAKKRLLNFDVRDIQKSNLNRRDYKFLANKTGDDTMTESKLYGTARLSYQDVDSARIVIKHTESVSENRTQKIGSIYIENAQGERFKYPYKHVNGARAMARHVAEGGNQYDEFGKHILGLSEELNKLRKFKTYMTRSGVMAEGLSGYMDVVNERIDAVKNTVHKMQRKSFYTEMFDNYEAVVMEDVPEDVAGDWIDQLTIRQFNEELKDVFPYIYKLVSEATRAVELGPEELVDESGLQYYTGVKKHGKEYMKKAAQAGREGASQEELGRLKDKYSKAAKNKKASEELEIEAAFERMMGQFAEDESGAEVFHDGTTIYPKVGDKVEIFGSEYTDGPEEEHTSRAVGVIVGPHDPSKQLWKIKYKRMGPKEYGGGEVVNDILSSHDEFVILDKDRDNPDRIKDREQGELPMPGGKTNRRNVKDPAGESDMDGPMDVKIGPDGALSKADGPEAKPEKPKLPIAEFILTMFDRETGKFPKGETAVLTAVEKDYGEDKIDSAKDFIERIMQKYEDVMVPMEPVVHEVDDEEDDDDSEFNRFKKLAKGILKNPLKGDKVAKDINKKMGRDLAGNKLDDSIAVDLAKLAGIK